VTTIVAGLVAGNTTTAITKSGRGLARIVNDQTFPFTFFSPSFPCWHAPSRNKNWLVACQQFYPEEQYV
jgi:hypothetical protein